MNGRNEMAKENRPLVLYGHGGIQWADAIPEWLRTAIKEERLVYSTMGKEEAGDCECLAYLITASLVEPLSGEGYKAYMYFAAKVLKKRIQQLPDFLQDVEPLSEYDQQELKKLRVWLYNQSMKAFKIRKSVDKRSKPQLKLFAVGGAK